MTLTPAAREQMRKEFRQKTDEAFDAMFAEDQQEQLITLVQREDRVLQQGAELQAWLLERHLQYDPWADPAKAETLRCPQCRKPGVRDTHRASRADYPGWEAGTTTLEVPLPVLPNGLFPPWTFG